MEITLTIVSMSFTSVSLTIETEVSLLSTKPELLLDIDTPLVSGIVNRTIPVQGASSSLIGYSPVFISSFEGLTLRATLSLETKATVLSKTMAYSRIEDIVVDSGPELVRLYDLRIDCNQELDIYSDIVVYDDNIYNKGLNLTPITYPGAIPVPIAMRTCADYYKDDWGGALIGGIPLSEMHAFLTKDTTIDLIGEVINRTIAIPGSNGVLFLDYSIGRPNIYLYIHIYIEDWPDGTEPMDLVASYEQVILGLFNPAKGLIDITLEPYPDIKFRAVQTDVSELSITSTDAVLKIKLGILQDLDAIY